METIHLPASISLTFVRRGKGGFHAFENRVISGCTLHKFSVRSDSTNGLTIQLTAPDGAVAHGVWHDCIERLPVGYIWVKFKQPTSLVTATRNADRSWKWQATIKFRSDRFYAVKIDPTTFDSTEDCNLVTRDGVICPYTCRNYFTVVSESAKGTLPKVLEAFPAPVPGIQRIDAPDVWDAPTEYDCVPIISDNHTFEIFQHDTIKPVAALRLDFDQLRNPIYRCSYFGPRPK